MDSKKFNGYWNNLGEGYNLSYVFFVWTFQIYFFVFLLELEKITSIQKYYQIRLIESYWSMFLEYKVERCAISKLVRICWHIKIYQWNRFFFSSRSWNDNLPTLYAQGILGISSDRSCKNSEACCYTLSPSLYYIIMQNWACRIFSGEIRVLSLNKFFFGDILLTTEDVW